MEIASGALKGERHLTALQKKFLKSGFDDLEDRERIELLLSLALPRQERKKVAKACIQKFKNLRGFLAASPKELTQAGITLPCMFSIKLLHELPKAVLKEKIIEKPVHSCARDVFDYLQYSMQNLKKEIFKVLYLNNGNQIINAADLFEGTLVSIPIHTREIIENAINYRATRLIFAHNHPSGDPTPSKSDKRLTRDLVFIGMIMEIRVLDHIVIGSDEYFSFADEGLICKYEDDFLSLRIRGLFDIGVEHFKR